MSSMVQTVIWVSAGACLFIFLRRRRGRRTQH
jgi:hypothetical protein